MPSKGKAFTMKQRATTEKEMVAKSLGDIADVPSLNKGAKANDLDLTGSVHEMLTDARGLNNAYQKGDAFAKKTILHAGGGHTPRDWFGDVTKYHSGKSFREVSTTLLM